MAMDINERKLYLARRHRERQVRTTLFLRRFEDVRSDCLARPHKGRMSFKVDTDRFLELTDQPGMMPAPYMARAFWVSITEPERFGDAQTKTFVRRSYELVRSRLSKKLKRRWRTAEPSATVTQPLALNCANVTKWPPGSR
jgi:predicted DNA-binding protein (MmcQ/YjbR family)